MWQETMARDHGKRPWQETMARDHGKRPWQETMARDQTVLDKLCKKSTQFF